MGEAGSSNAVVAREGSSGMRGVGAAVVSSVVVSRRGSALEVGSETAPVEVASAGFEAGPGLVDGSRLVDSPGAIDVSASCRLESGNGAADDVSGGADVSKGKGSVSVSTSVSGSTTVLAPPSEGERPVTAVCDAASPSGVGSTQCSERQTKPSSQVPFP